MKDAKFEVQTLTYEFEAGRVNANFRDPQNDVTVIVANVPYAGDGKMTKNELEREALKAVKRFLAEASKDA